MANTQNGSWQLVRLAIDRDGAFLHGLEQGGLGLRWRPVDLVTEKKLREHGPRSKAEGAFARVKHAGTGDIRRHEVGRELDAVELTAQRRRQGSHEERLRHAGRPLEQHVSAGEDSRERKAHLVLEPDQDAAGLRDDCLGSLAGASYRRRNFARGRNVRQLLELNDVVVATVFITRGVNTGVRRTPAGNARPVGAQARVAGFGVRNLGFIHVSRPLPRCSDSGPSSPHERAARGGPVCERARPRPRRCQPAREATPSPSP